MSGRDGCSRERARLRRVRVVLADPPAFTPPYDHELAAALARAGVDVELATSPFRFGSVPEPDGLPPQRAVLRRLVAPLRPLAPARAAEAARAPARARAAPPRCRRTCCTCSGSPSPRSTAALLRPRVPAVLTAHDLLPRRTAAKTGLWRRLFARFDARRRAQRARARHARPARAAPTASASSPTPSSAATRRAPTTAAPLLFFGVIRPYRGLEDALEATGARARA